MKFIERLWPIAERLQLIGFIVVTAVGAILSIAILSFYISLAGCLFSWERCVARLAHMDDEVSALETSCSTTCPVEQEAGDTL